MLEHTTRTLSTLEPGDSIHAIGSIKRATPLVVQRGLAPIEPGSPVKGVYCGTMKGGVEMYLYPSQCDGLEIVYTR